MTGVLRIGLKSQKKQTRHRHECTRQEILVHSLNVSLSQLPSDWFKMSKLREEYEIRMLLFLLPERNQKDIFPPPCIGNVVFLHIQEEKSSKAKGKVWPRIMSGVYIKLCLFTPKGLGMVLNFKCVDWIWA